MEELPMESFSSAFDAVGETGNWIVMLNNNLVDGVERIEELGKLLTGGIQVKVETSKNTVAVVYMREENKVEVSSLEGSKEFTKASATLDKLVEQFNTLVSGVEGLELKAKGSRIKVASMADDMDKTIKKDVKKQVVNLNSALFSVKMEVLKMGGKDALNLAKALKDGLAEMKKQVNNMSPKLKVNTDGIADGEVELEIDFGIDADALFGKPKEVYDALLSEDEENRGLIPIIIETVKELPSIAEKMNELKEAVEGLPKDGAAIKSEAEAAGAAGMELLKIPKKVATNTQEFGKLPGMVKTLTENVKDIVSQVQEAF
uniref:Uncharacterized protein n=1 Tax=Heterosigma akashiwo TaxID=2829 RepID=A0A7S3YIS9_HETAK